MKLTSYWPDAAAPFSGTSKEPVAGKADVVIIAPASPARLPRLRSPRRGPGQVRGVEPRSDVKSGAIPVFISLVDAFDARLKGVFPIPIGGLMGYSFGAHVGWDG